FGREATVTQVHLPDAFCQELPQISFYARLVRPVHLGQQHPRYHQRNACLRQRHKKSLIPPEELLPEHLSPLAFGSVDGPQSKIHIRSKETHIQGISWLSAPACVTLRSMADTIKTIKVVRSGPDPETGGEAITIQVQYDGRTATILLKPGWLP